MAGDPVPRIGQLSVTMPAAGADEGRRFGETLARELQHALAGEAGGHIGALEIRVAAADDAVAVARAVRDAVRRSRR